MADPQLPAYTTTFIGRDTEAHAIAELVRTTDQRLITLLGPSGAGKTRLSLQVIELVQNHFPDGCFWVALAPISDAGLVLPTIAQTLDIQELSNVPLLETLAAALGNKRILLVLDNIEQVIEASTELNELLQKTQDLVLLITSQRALKVTAEHCFPVPPLDVPETSAGLNPAELMQYPSIALFVERMQAVQPAFQFDQYNAAAVVEICRRVLGLPLAIELVAAHSHDLTPENLLLLVRNYLPLHLTSDQQLRREELIKPVLQWCYRILRPVQQRVLMRCGIFSGGWTAEAAEHICNDPNTRLDVVNELEYLASRHLLLTEQLSDGTLRYHMIDAIRDFTLSHLQQRRQHAQVAVQHSEWYAQQARSAGPGRTDALNKLAREHHNLREALLYLIHTHQAALATQLAGDLGVYWYIRGHWSEGFRLLKQAEPLGSEAPPAVQAKALNWIAAMYVVRGDSPLAKTYFEQALALYEQAGERQGELGVRNNLGIVARDHGDYEAAETYMQSALELAEELQDTHRATSIANNFGLLLRSKGQAQAALELHQRYLPIVKQLDDQYNEGLTLLNLGTILHDLQRYAEAKPYIEASLAICRQLHVQHYVADALCVLAHIILHHEHDQQTACRLKRESIQIRSEMQDFRGLAVSLEYMASFALYANDAMGAATLMGGASAIRERVRFRLSPNEVGVTQTVHQQLSQQLSAAKLKKAQATGAALSDADLLALMQNMLARLEA